MWQRRFHFPLATFTSFLLVARAQQHRPRYVPGFVSFIQSSTPEVNFPVSNPQNVCSVAFFVVVVVVVVVVFRWNSHSVSILTKKKRPRNGRAVAADSTALPDGFFWITGSVATFLFSSPPIPRSSNVDVVYIWFGRTGWNVSLLFFFFKETLMRSGHHIHHIHHVCHPKPIVIYRRRRPPPPPFFFTFLIVVHRKNKTGNAILLRSRIRR